MYLPSSNAAASFRLSNCFHAVFHARRYLVAAVLALFTLWLIAGPSPDINSLRNFPFLTNNNGGKKTTGGAAGVTTTDKWFESRDKFVERSVEKGIYPYEYDGTAVRELCARTEWREGLFISCDKIAGGIGNLKMRLLGCVRYAIEAGAALVTPVIHPRQAYRLMEDSFGWETDLPLDYMFETEHFYATLQADCPQLRFVNESDPTLNVPPKTQSLPISPKALVPTKWDHILLNPERWRAALDEWLTEFVVKPRGNTLSPYFPIRLSFDDGVQFSWPTAHDGDAFKQDFGLAAQFPRHVRAMGARVLYELYQRAGCHGQDPAALSQGCFLGVHIRTEEDAAIEHWDSYETQLLHVREQLLTNQLRVLYVATGKRSDVARLKQDVADIRVVANATSFEPVLVLDKWDLIDEQDTMRMDELSWDQVAVVDYEVMLRATRFAGIWESSWTWMITLMRHCWAPPGVSGYATAVTFEDGLSIIYGEPGAQPVIAPAIYV